MRFRYDGTGRVRQPSSGLSRSIVKPIWSPAMQIPHDSFVLVADGRKSLFFRNQGDAEFPNLHIEEKESHENPAHHEQAADTAGQAASPVAGVSATMGEVDFHKLEEDRFAADTAAMLKERALRNEFDSLVVVAPPKTLGELRKHYHKEVEKRLLAEVPKDLVNVPVAEIEKILQGS
jgi:protein required for attachment to host cells